MAGKNAMVMVPIEAGEDLSGDLYKFGVINASGQLVVNTTADGLANGIVCEEVDAAGKVTSMAVPNGAIVKVRLGATLAAGAEVGSDNAGRAKAAGTALNNYALGTLLQGGDADEIVEMQFVILGRHGGAS